MLMWQLLTISWVSCIVPKGTLIRQKSICLKKLGPNHVGVANSYNSLGSVHRELGRLQRAKDFHDCTLAIRLKELRLEHVDVAVCYNDLGSVHCDLLTGYGKNTALIVL